MPYKSLLRSQSYPSANKREHNLNITRYKMFLAQVGFPVDEAESHRCWECTQAQVHGSCSQPPPSLKLPELRVNSYRKLLLLLELLEGER